MGLIEKIDEGLFRLLVPFEEITTTVYFAVTKQGAAIIDAATYSSDVDDYILPALQALKIQENEVCRLLLTHPHSDHAGGAKRLVEQLPHLSVCAAYLSDLPNFTKIVDGEIILDCLQAVVLPGHTENSTAFLDLRSNTLLSGDCLQLKGIGKYVHGVTLPKRYKASVERLKTMPISRIVAAHEYEPLGSKAEGKEEVERYLIACLDALKENG